MANIDGGGGGGINTLTGRNVVTDWQITAANAGFNTHVNRFNNIQNLVGGSNSDIFTLSVAGSVNSIDGAGGTNRLKARDVANTWAVNRSNGGNVTHVNSFSNIQNLVGGSQTDSFILSDTGSVNTLDGAGGANSLKARDTANAWNINAASGGSVTNVNSFSSIQNLIGGSNTDDFTLSTMGSINSIDGAGGTNRLKARDEANIWNINTLNGGSVSNVARFNNIQNITGGADTDAISFTASGDIAEMIDGGEGNDSLTITALTNDVIVELGSSDFDNLNVINVETITANSTKNNTIIGGNSQNSWTITSLNKGSVDISGGITTVFNNFKKVTGGNGDDNFKITGSEAQISGLIIDGGAESSGDTLDVTDQAGFEITVGQEVAINGVSITDIEGVNATDGILNARDGVTTTWNINELNSGNVSDNGSGNVNMTFAGFTTLNGGTGVDRFNITERGSVSGSINGHGSDDVLNVALSSYAGGVTFNGGVGNNTVNLTGGNSTYNGIYMATLADAGRFVYEDNGAEYVVNYTGADIVSDTATANSLTVYGMDRNNALTLTNDTFIVAVAEGLSETVTYDNKNSLILGQTETDVVTVEGVSANTQNITLTAQTLNINAELDLKGSLTLRGGAVNADSHLITAKDLIFDNVTSAGTLNGPVQTSIENLSIMGSGPVYINEENALNLIKLETSELVNVQAVGEISGSNLVSVADLVLISTDYNISLSGTNKLSGSLNLRGGDIHLNNSVSTDLASVTARSLTMNTTADITDSGQVNVTGATNLTSTGNIILDTGSNDFSTVTATGGDRVTIHDANSIVVDITASGTADVSADDRITSGTLRANKVVLEAGTGIGTTGSTRTFINTQANILNVNNATGGVAISNDRSVFVEAMKTAGDINFNVTGDVTIHEIDAGYEVGSLDMRVTGSVFGDPTQLYHESPIDITANNAFILVTNDFGTQVRPISVKVKNNFTLFSRQSATYYFGGEPRFINDQSDIKLKVFDALGGLWGQQLIEVESLADIDPAIFTEVRNYYHADLAIMMPEDQLYTEEEREERRRMTSDR